MANGPLEGCKVIDLSQHVAGPYCTKLFADYGAEVVKVEEPGTGDTCRRLGPFPNDIPHPEKSGLFLHLNTNKKSLTLNIATKTGRKILKKLLKDADILIESYTPGTMDSFGLGYEEIEKINPKLVMTSISNFGQTGPYRDYKATDMTEYAMGGALSITGLPDEGPSKIGNYAGLYLSGGTAAAFTMSAFYGARFGSVGQYIDMSLQEAAAGSMDRTAPNLAAYAYSGDLLMRRATTRRVTMPPSGVYPCKDGFIHIVMQVAWWPRFCRMVGRPDMIDEPHWKENLFNVEMAGEMDAFFLSWTLERGKQEIMEKGQNEGVAITAYNTMEDVFKDPHLRFREFFTEIDHPVAGKFEYPGPPFKMRKTPWKAGRAPLLGEHNEEILIDQLGYTKQDIVLLRGRGII